MNLGRVKLIEVRCDLVQLVRVQVALDVRGDGRRRVTHRFLDVAKVGARFPGQACVGMPKAVDRQRS